jgi:Ca2+-binding EF-hand superfamily protein
MNFGNIPLMSTQPNHEDRNNSANFPNGKQTLKFEEFINIIKDSCMDKEQAENYLVYAFSMFDRKKKGYIN